MVSFNQRVIFIEGEDSSADRQIYESFFPPGHYNISFVPAGNSATTRATADRVNSLLTSGIGFHHYFSIIDGDIERAVDAPECERLFKLPVYHVENFLLDEEVIFQVTKSVLGGQCPYDGPEAVADKLKELVFSEIHMNPFARAHLDARVAKLAKAAWDSVYQGTDGLQNSEKPEFSTIKSEAEEELKQALFDGSWKKHCKGRDLLRAYCSLHKIKYEHFRNLLIDQLGSPPAPLQQIMDKILKN